MDSTSISPFLSRPLLTPAARPTFTRTESPVPVVPFTQTPTTSVQWACPPSLSLAPSHSLPQIRLSLAPWALPPLSAVIKSRSPTWTTVKWSRSLWPTIAPPARTQTQSTSPSLHSKLLMTSPSAYSPVSPFIPLSNTCALISQKSLGSTYRSHTKASPCRAPWWR